MASLSTHSSPLAGAWYPRDAAHLRQILDSSLHSSLDRTGSFLRPGGVAFLVPHAAPIYSGAVASAVYRHLQAAGPARVLVLGFSHRHGTHGISVPGVDAISTPLGTVEVDRAAAAGLADEPPFHWVAEQSVCDHSVEIQLPFLQATVPGAAIVPLYVGDLSPTARRAAAQRLAGLLDGSTVLLASSDLTHYGRDFGYLPFPPDDEPAERLHALDAEVLSAAASLDTALFTRRLESSGATVCGAAPLQLLMETVAALPGDYFGETLDYDTSGAMAGDFHHSVSYGAAGYFPASSYELDAEAQAELLAAARFALDHYRRTGERCFPPESPLPQLAQRGRAFVTIYTGGDVKGCVGCFEHPFPLVTEVPRLAVEALHDARFGPILDADPLAIEIHILTPPRLVAGTDAFQCGRHGAFLRSSGRRGLLLPSVATRYGMSHDRFLTELALKAGLSPSVYSGREWELSVFLDQSFASGPAGEPSP